MGKFALHFSFLQENGTQKKVPITSVNHMPDPPFPLDKFPVNEESLPIWTSLFYLASQVSKQNDGFPMEIFFFRLEIV